MHKVLAVDRKNNIKNILLDIITIALVVIYILPQFVSFQYTSIIALALGVSWMLVAFSSNPHFFLGGNKYFTKAIICFGILIIISLLSSQNIIANRYAGLALTSMFFWIYSYNSVLRGLKYNIRIVLLSLVPIIYTSLITVAVLLTNPYASRMVKSSVDGNIELAQSGVSGYSLIYAAVIMAITLIPILIERNRIKLGKLNKLLVWALLILFLSLIVLSNFFTALIAAVFAILSITLLFRSKRMLFLLIPISIIYLTLHKDINLMVIDTVLVWVQPEGITRIRLDEMKTELLIGAKSSSIDTRSDRLDESIEVLTSYPIIGYIAGSGTEFDLQKIGQHSTVLDTFAMYGIIMGSFFFWIMLLPFKYIISRGNSYKMKTFGWIIGLAFIFLIVFNNLTASIGYAAFFFFPTVFDYLNSHDGRAPQYRTTTYGKLTKAQRARRSFV